MKKIPLTQGQFAIVDDEDFERVSKLKWYAAKKRSTFYAQREHKKTCLKMHRFILGITDSAVIIDHKNGNGLDNTRGNIRICRNAENCMNRNGLSSSSSKYKGVSWCRHTNKWKAQIRFNGKLYYLGVYESELESARVYDKAAKKHFGEFAWLNNV